MPNGPVLGYSFIYPLSPRVGSKQKRKTGRAQLFDLYYYRFLYGILLFFILQQIGGYRDFVIDIPFVDMGHDLTVRKGLLDQFELPSGNGYLGIGPIGIVQL